VRAACVSACPTRAMQASSRMVQYPRTLSHACVYSTSCAFRCDVHVELVAIAQTVEFIVERAGRGGAGAYKVADGREQQRQGKVSKEKA
jgi:Fe-S-cluster-containing hydrogenase component 2